MTDKIRKDTAGYCPKCDTIHAVRTPSIEFVSGDYICVHHVCDNCGEEWDVSHSTQVPTMARMRQARRRKQGQAK